MNKRIILSAVTAGLLATASDYSSETFMGHNRTTLTKIGQKAPSWMGNKKTKKYNSRSLKKRVHHTNSRSRRNAKQLREHWLATA